MIYVTGDTHGSINISKLNSKNFPQGKNLTKDDYVIVCGDFGLVWADNGEDYYWRDWLNKKPWTTLFIDGNHENFDLLYQFPVKNKWGGKTHQINDSIYHLCRGQVFEIDNKKILTMGGADSHDKQFKAEYISWWPQEMPNYMEYEDAMYNLVQNNWKVDYILTHCAPLSIHKEVILNYKPDVLTLFLEQLLLEVSYKKWYCGHYHIDKDFKNISCLFNRIIPIEGED